MAKEKGTSSDLKKVRKAINFDLDTKKLKEVYGDGTNISAAYYEIKRFFKKHGFEHRQGSGYCSEFKMTKMEVLHVAKEMNEALPWMKNCIKNIDVTDIGTIHSLGYVFESDQEIEQDIKQLKTQKDIKQEKTPGPKLRRRGPEL